MLYNSTTQAFEPLLNASAPGHQEVAALVYQADLPVPRRQLFRLSIECGGGVSSSARLCQDPDPESLGQSHEGVGVVRPPLLCILDRAAAEGAQVLQTVLQQRPAVAAASQPSLACQVL